MNRSILHQLKLTDELITRYINNGSIIIDKDELLISSPSLAITLFLRALESNIHAYSIINSITIKDIQNYIILLYKFYNKDINDIKPLLNKITDEYLDSQNKKWLNIFKYIFGDNSINICLPYEESSTIGRYILLLKKYIKNREYKLAYTILNNYLISLINNDIHYKILLNLLDSLEDNLIYIGDESEELDVITLEEIKNIERRFLIDLEISNNDFVKDLNLLKMICPNTITKNMLLLLLQLNKFIKDKTYVSSHIFLSNFGPVDDVIIELINVKDFYRIRDLIDEKIKSEHASIKYKLYKILIDRIMYFNNRNMNYLKEQVKISISSDNYEDVLRNKNLNNIDVSLIKDEYNGVDLSRNYYNLYMKYKGEKNYEEAKKCLLQFKCNMDFLQVKCEVDYLLKELEVEMLNNNKTPREEELIASLNEILNGTNDLKEKISICQELLKYDRIKNPHTLIYIANCYRALGMLDDAINYYYMAENIYLYPEDYISIMEILIDLKQYDKVIDYAYKCLAIKDDETGYLHYLMSIAYAYLGEYYLAVDSLLETKTISYMYNNVEYDLSVELNILEKLKDGKHVKMYDKEDYIDFTLSKDEEKIKSELETSIGDNYSINSRISEFGLDDKIDYLLSVLKVCKYLDKKEIGMKVIGFTYDLLDNHDELKNKNSALRKLSVYKENFTQKKL